MILVLASTNTPRLQYVTTQVFEHWLGQEIKIVTSVEEFAAANGLKINYTSSAEAADIHIYPSGLLSDTGIHSSAPRVGTFAGVPVLFPNENVQGFGFDFFSAVFYMLSRMEEYEFTSTDKFGRFSAVQSLAHQHEFLDIPVVDAWIDLFIEALPANKQSFSKPDAFKFLCTIDVDNAFAIFGKPWWRQVLASGRDLLTGKPGFIFKRWKIWRGKSPDPNDTYAFIEKTSAVQRINVTFFYLLGDYGQYDKNLTWNSPEMSRVIQKNAEWSVAGIHPSFHSSQKPDLFQRETQRLRDLTKARVNASRQHYLKCSFPSTFMHLLDVGIRNDFTLGFHDLPGYRAGTGRPFYFYNVTTDTSTELLLQPFVLMDGTLHDYMKLGPDAAFKKTEEIFATAKKYGTPVCTLWHNDTVNDHGAWRGWQRIFLRQFGLAVR